MMRHIAILFGVLALFAVSIFPSAPAEANCVVTGTETFIAGTYVPDDKCGLSGGKKVEISGGNVGASSTATAASPSYTEGYTNAALSVDLAGNLRTTMGTLLSCEDQLNTLCMTSGGAVRQTSVASGLLVAADCTSHCTPAVVVTLPVGSKTFTSTISSATSGDTIVKQTHTIYGSNSSGLTSDDAVQLCQLIFPATTQYLTKAFTQSCPPVTGNWLYYGVISSGTGSGAGVVTGAVTATY